MILYFFKDKMMLNETEKISGLNNGSDLIVGRFKNMTPDRRLDLSLRLYYNARELKTAVIHQLHPELTEKELENKVRNIFLYARS